MNPAGTGHQIKDPAARLIYVAGAWFGYGLLFCIGGAPQQIMDLVLETTSGKTPVDASALMSALAYPLVLSLPLLIGPFWILGNIRRAREVKAQRDAEHAAEMAEIRKRREEGRIAEW